MKPPFVIDDSERLEYLCAAIYEVAGTLTRIEALLSPAGRRETPDRQPALPSKRFQIRLMLAPHVFVFRVYAESSAIAKEILISLLKDEMTCDEIPHKSDAL